MADTPQPIVTQAPTDAGGNWQGTIDAASVAPGLHTVTAVGPDGSRDDSLLFVDRTNSVSSTSGDGLASSLFARGSVGFVPPLFAVAMFLFLLLIVALAVNGVRLGRHADLTERRAKSGIARHRHARSALAFSVLALALAFYVGVLVNQRSGAFDRFFPARAPSVVTVSVAGAVVTPFGNQPVAGVDLVAGDTAIRTDASGRFAFTDIGAADGIRLTHPSLSRALRFDFLWVQRNGARSPAVSSNVPFDAGMYNALIAAVNEDARRGQGIFSPADVADQTLDIDHVVPDAPSHTVRVTVRNGSDTSLYKVREDEKGWTAERSGD